VTNGSIIDVSMSPMLTNGARLKADLEDIFLQLTRGDRH
jgi:hypothetical protein